jgi:hypothetical protein
MTVPSAASAGRMSLPTLAFCAATAKRLADRCIAVPIGLGRPVMPEPEYFADSQHVAFWGVPHQIHQFRLLGLGYLVGHPMPHLVMKANLAICACSVDF